MKVNPAMMKAIVFLQWWRLLCSCNDEGYCVPAMMKAIVFLQWWRLLYSCNDEGYCVPCITTYRWTQTAKWTNGRRTLHNIYQNAHLKKMIPFIVVLTLYKMVDWYVQWVVNMTYITDNDKTIWKKRT